MLSFHLFLSLYAMNDKTIKDKCFPAQECEQSILVQSGSAKKITDFQELNTLSGNEVVVVALGNQNFKIPVSLITSSGFNGQSGTSGRSGFSGFSSFSGSSGFSGQTIIGQSGFSGGSGFSGAGQSGSSGFSGVSGQGISGISGFSGLGIQGESGFSGFSGLGQSGFSGFSGLSGRLTVPGLGYVVRINDALNTYATRTLQYEPPLEASIPNGVAGNSTIYYDEQCAVNSFFTIASESISNTASNYGAGHVFTLDELFQTQNVLDNRATSDKDIRSYSIFDTFYNVDAYITLNLASANAGTVLVLAFGTSLNPIFETVYTIPNMTPDNFQHTVHLSGMFKLDNAETYNLRLYMPTGAVDITNVASPRSYLTLKGVIK